MTAVASERRGFVPCPMRPRWPRVFRSAARRQGIEARYGARVYRRLDSGVVVLRRESSAARRLNSYWAFAGDLEVAKFSRWEGVKDHLPVGHVCGDYSRVQGAGADCKTFTAWLAAVTEVDVDATVAAAVLGTATPKRCSAVGEQIVLFADAAEAGAAR